MLDVPAFDERARSRSRSSTRSVSRSRPIDDIPLGTLLKNYLVLLAQEPRNITIVVLGFIVLFLVTRVNPSQYAQRPAASLDHLPELESPMSPIYLTSTTTATTTAISISTATSTTTVTHVERYSVSPSAVPSPETILSAPLNEDPSPAAADADAEMETPQEPQESATSSTEMDAPPSGPSSSAVDSEHDAVNVESGEPDEVIEESSSDVSPSQTASLASEGLPTTEAQEVNPDDDLAWDHEQAHNEDQDKDHELKEEETSHEEL